MATKNNAAINLDDPYPARRTYIPADLTYETMSELGRELVDLSRDYEAAGEKLYGEEAIEKEIARRKGGYGSSSDE